MKLIDVRSAIAGAGLVATVFGLSGMMQAPSHLPPFQIEGIPTPQQMMRVVEGTPFTVPAGKVFVITGVGASNLAPPASTVIAIDIAFDGSVVLQKMLKYTDSAGVSLGMDEVPAGLVALSGTVVEPDNVYAGADGVLFGYLADG